MMAKTYEIWKSCRAMVGPACAGCSCRRQLPSAVFSET